MYQCPKFACRASCQSLERNVTACQASIYISSQKLMSPVLVDLSGTCGGGMAGGHHGAMPSTTSSRTTWGFTRFISCCQLCVSWSHHLFVIQSLLGYVSCWNLQHVKLFDKLRYHLGEWFNLCERSGRYLDDEAIQNTSSACEPLLHTFCNFCRLQTEYPEYAVILFKQIIMNQDQCLNSYFILAEQSVALGLHLYPAKPKCHVPLFAK